MVPRYQHCPHLRYSPRTALTPALRPPTSRRRWVGGGPATTRNSPAQEFTIRCSPRPWCCPRGYAYETTEETLPVRLSGDSLFRQVRHHKTRVVASAHHLGFAGFAGSSGFALNDPFRPAMLAPREKANSNHVHDRLCSGRFEVHCCSPGSWRSVAFPTLGRCRLPTGRSVACAP